MPAPEKHLVFVVHGMGKFKKDWSKPLQTALVDASKQYASFKKQGQALLDRVEFKEIAYDSHFESILTNWESNAQAAIDAAQTDAEKALVRDSLHWIEGSSGDKASFFWTHIVDAMLWRINPYVRHSVMTDVAKTMVQAIEQQLKHKFDRRFSIIAHSLGTSVTHDVLDALAKGDWEEAPQPYGYSGKDVRLASVHMVANVSRMLEVHERPALHSYCRPGPAGDGKSYCFDFYNYAHDLDPFTWARRFAPDWPPSVYHGKSISHIHQPNVHDLEHYLAAPLVHVPILRSLCRFETVTKEEEVDAVLAFPQIAPELKAIADQLKEGLTKAKQAMGESPDLIDFLKGAAVFSQVIKEMKDEIDALHV